MRSSEQRTDLLCALGDYMASADEHLLEVQNRAVRTNSWFTEESVSMAVKGITEQFLQREKLEEWMVKYTPVSVPKKVGIVMAGNIPLVGFHDLLCGYMSGNNIVIKPSSKDEVLIKHLIAKATELDPTFAEQVQTSDMLKGCDAYIATGSNNTARYFEQYFAQYPHIIRKNRTSVAVLDGTETDEQLNRLASDVFSYFGLGCRNVTQVCVPEDYDFARMLEVFRNHEDMIVHHKYKNNYDYHLAVYLLNRVPYLTNDSLLLVENTIPFSAVSVLHYRYYTDKQVLLNELRQSEEIQCIVGKDAVAFGNAQLPSLTDYPDGVDTMAFLCGL